MPTYDYYCPHNGARVEVIHGMNEQIATWAELCTAGGIAPGETPPDAPVRKLISAPGLAFPKTNTELKNLGFTKLVKREKGVYENVTAGEGEARYMKSDDPNSMPKFTGKISD
jgi:hypothetical protein